jgi:Domain of Unknown Function (DUF928)
MWVDSMGRHLQQVLFGFLALISIIIDTAADTPNSGNGNASAVTFVPPTDGAPSRRVGAGTRSGAVLDNGIIKLIVPAGGGETASASPTLVWNFSHDVDGELRLELTDAANQKSWLIFRETGKWKTGLNGLSLADFGIAMKKGQILDWRMTFVPTGGSDPLPEVQSFVEYTSAVLPHAAAASAMRAFGASGLWFDALAAGTRLSVSDAIEMTDPVNVKALLVSGGTD